MQEHDYATICFFSGDITMTSIKKTIDKFSKLGFVDFNLNIVQELGFTQLKLQARKVNNEG